MSFEEDFLKYRSLQNGQNFIEHAGKKGMKWGQRKAQGRAAKGPDRFGNRNNFNAQKSVDRLKRVASGKASLTDKVRVGLTTSNYDYVSNQFSLKDAAGQRLERAKRTKRKVESGKKNVTDIMSRLGGVDIRDLKI
jgi:hypothetical protein